MDNETAPIDMGSISLLIPPSRDGDPKARDVLFQELENYLSLVARSNLDPQMKPKAGVSDIVQESFLKIVQNFDSFRGETSGELKAWIKTIVKNEISGMRRSYKTGKRDVDREISMSPAHSTAMGVQPVDD
ncbi:MAG: sigma factor, partial [Planctomycetota bacterium]